MRRLRKRQLKYGVTSGVFVFGVLWLTAALTIPQEPPGGLPRWKASLWLLLGMHFIEIVADTGSFTTGAVDVTQLSEAPLNWLRIAPPVALAGASFYAARQISRTRRLRYNIENAATVLVGYLPLLILAFIISDANPQLETALTIVSIAAVAIYIGSVVLSKLTDRLPFFGVTSLGTIILVGLITLVVGVEVLTTFAGGFAILGGGVLVGALGTYLLRAGSTGHLRGWIARNAPMLFVFLILSGGLYIVLDGPTPDQDFNNPLSGIDISTEVNETKTEEEVFALVNQERRVQGLQSLSYNNRVHQAAKAHARDMGERDYFNHTSPDGETQQQRYAFCTGGENIAQSWVYKRIETPSGTEQHTDAAELARGIFDQWMNSRPHRERGIRGQWSSGAAAIHITDDDKVFAVFGFCR